MSQVKAQHYLVALSTPHFYCSAAFADQVKSLLLIEDSTAIRTIVILQVEAGRVRLGADTEFCIILPRAKKRGKYQLPQNVHDFFPI